MMADAAADDFRFRELPVVGKRVCRMGLAGSFGIDGDGVRLALGELGLNYIYWTPRMGKATPAVREALAADRERYVIATGPVTAWWGDTLRRHVERALKVLGTDYLDVLQMHWLGVTAAYAPRTVDTMMALRDEGKVRAIGTSIHNRKRAGELAADSDLDLLMIRYNAAHPGAESDIFPHLAEGKAVIAYTATSWRRLLKPRRGWDGRVPTAGDCYRFCLSSPHVDVTLMGPKNVDQLKANVAALDHGPLDDQEMKWMRDFGLAVHG